MMPNPLTLYIVALAAAAAATAVSFPLWAKVAWRAGLVDDPGPRKLHDKPAALAGGFAIATGIVLPLLGLWVVDKLASAPQTSWWNYVLELQRTDRIPWLPIGAGGLAMLLLGMADDRWELPPLRKFAGQLLIATLVSAAGVRVPLLSQNGIGGYAATILWVMTITNAVNFTDNINGLATGLGLVAAGFAGLLAASHGQVTVAAVAFLICGACIGFLPANFPRGRVFLGDSGSHLVGYLLAAAAILPAGGSSATLWTALCPILLLAVPLADLCRVVFVRWRLRQPVYIGDTNHLSHWLVRRGWSAPGAVLILWAVAVVTGALALLLGHG